MWQKDRAERVQFNLQVQNTESPKECGVDLIRHNCLHPESSQLSLISSILQEVPFGFFQWCPFKGTQLVQLFHTTEWKKKDCELSTILSRPLSMLLADL